MGAIGDVLEDHRADLFVVATQEVLGLVVHDGKHCFVHRFVALPNRIDEPAGRFYFLANKLYRFFLTAGQFAGAALVVVRTQHVPKRIADAQVGCIAHVEVQLQFAITVQHNKIGDNVLTGTLHRSRNVATGGFGIEFQDFVDGGFELLFGQAELPLQFFKMLFGKSFKLPIDDFAGCLEGNEFFIVQVFPLFDADQKLDVEAFL